MISKKINIPRSHIIMLYDVSSNAHDEYFWLQGLLVSELFPLLYFNILYCKDSETRFDKGFGIYFQGRWAQGGWPKEWADNGILADITF
jgi:hypothetical protein